MRRWPAKCTLMGCSRPGLRPHHHHWYRGHLSTAACACPHGGEPGTSAPDRQESDRG